MKITGAGVISAGEYTDEISVCGSGKISGNVTCSKLKCSGALKSLGDIISNGDVKVSGSMRTDGNIKACDISVSGACTANSDVYASGEISVSGSLRVGGHIKASKITASGSISAKSDIEAEEIKIDGRIRCGGLLNAEKIEIKLDHSENKVFGIGGSEINIYQSKTATFVNKVPLLSKIVGPNIGKLEVEESIEGDTVNVSYTKAPLVAGRVVEIGAECEIECVKYTENVNVDPTAKVGVCEKVI